MSDRVTLGGCFRLNYHLLFWLLKANGQYKCNSLFYFVCILKIRRFHSIAALSYQGIFSFRLQPGGAGAAEPSFFVGLKENGWRRQSRSDEGFRNFLIGDLTETSFSALRLQRWPGGTPYFFMNLQRHRAGSLSVAASAVAAAAVTVTGCVNFTASFELQLFSLPQLDCLQLQGRWASSSSSSSTGSK